MRFWLRRGVDGFRIDAAAVLAKDPQLRDDPPNPHANANMPPPERLRRDYSGHRDERVRGIPAAALTAYARVEDRMKALRAGFQIHLAKPIDPAELVTTIAPPAKRFPIADGG